MKQGKLENLDIYIINDWFDSKCTEKQFNRTSLLCWLESQNITPNALEIAEYEFEDETIITVAHNLGKASLGYVIRDEAGDLITSATNNDDKTNLTIDFGEPTTGTLTYFKKP